MSLFGKLTKAVKGISGTVVGKAIIGSQQVAMKGAAMSGLLPKPAAAFADTYASALGSLQKSTIKTKPASMSSLSLSGAARRGIGALPSAGVIPRLPGPAGGVVLAGQLMSRINWSKIWRAVKVLGLEAVAVALGMETAELASELIKRQPRKRRRGITARQLANARRVNRIIHNWDRKLSCRKR